MPTHLIIIISGNLLVYSCAYQQVSFKQDVSPILTSQCAECHTAPDGYGYKNTGLEMNSYDAIMQGTFYGPIIVAGDSRRSILNKLIEGRAGKMRDIMHAKGKDLPEQDIEILKAWVDQGALNN